MSKKRLDHNDQINLHAEIARGYLLRKIAEILGKSRFTIYRVIINNFYYKDYRHTYTYCHLNCNDKLSHYRNGQSLHHIYISSSIRQKNFVK